VAGPQAGDPFSRARSQSKSVSPHSPYGRKLAEEKARQQAAHQNLDRKGLKGLNGLGEPGAYAGYGFDPGGTQCPPSPTDAIMGCIDALKEMLGETFQLADLAPWIHPPFRTRDYTCKSAQAVVGPTLAASAAGNAAAVALAAAASGPGYVVPVVEVSAVGVGVPIYSIKPVQGEMARIKSWGLTPGNVAPKLIKVSVFGGTLGSSEPSPPDPFISGAAIGDQQETFALLAGNQQLEVRVALRDLLSPTLVTFGICFWTWAVNKRTDSKEGTLLRPGYGPCK